MSHIDRNDESNDSEKGDDNDSCGNHTRRMNEHREQWKHERKGDQHQKFENDQCDDHQTVIRYRRPSSLKEEKVVDGKLVCSLTSFHLLLFSIFVLSTHLWFLIRLLDRSYFFTSLRHFLFLSSFFPLSFPFLLRDLSDKLVNRSSRRY